MSQCGFKKGRCVGRKWQASGTLMLIESTESPSLKVFIISKKKKKEKS